MLVNYDRVMQVITKYPRLSITIHKNKILSMNVMHCSNNKKICMYSLLWMVVYYRKSP